MLPSLALQFQAQSAESSSLHMSATTLENLHLYLQAQINDSHERLYTLDMMNIGPIQRNDYSTGYIRTGILPQNHVLNIEDPNTGYPRLQKLHELKRQHNLNSVSGPVSVRIPAPQIPKFVGSLADSTAQFDVVMLHGCIEPFPLSMLEKMPIDRISSRPSLLFLWCPTSQIGAGRQLMEKWGFRRAEDIVYLVNSMKSPYAPQQNQKNVFQQTSWHCLMGLKGTLRRSTDSDLINCNVDTDVIIERQNTQRGVVPPEIYELVENFTSMGRRIHIVPTETAEQLPVRPRPGWVVVGPDAFEMGNFDPKDYKYRSVLPVLDEIDMLRPRTPVGRKA